MKKVLITGINGFVGQYMAKQLQHDNSYQIYGIKHNSNIENNSIESFAVNLEDKDEIDKIVFNIKPDYIYHLAARASVKKSWEDPITTIQANVIGTINLLEAVKNHAPLCRVLLTGSSEEYGSEFNSTPSLTEESKCAPQNIYAISKVTQNNIGNVYAKAYNLDIIMSRSFNHSGPGQSLDFAISNFCNQVAEIEQDPKEPIIKVGNLNGYRDFCDVRDVIIAYKLLIERGTRGETYNVGSGKSIKMEEILNIIIKKSLEKTGVKIRVEIDEKKFRPIETANIVANIDKIKKELGWEPKISIEQTIDDTLNYYRQKVIKKANKY